MYICAYPHPPIPAARLFFVFQCFAVFSSMWGNPEVGSGDNFLGSYGNCSERPHLRKLRVVWKLYVCIYIYIYTYTHTYTYYRDNVYIHIITV